MEQGTIIPVKKMIGLSGSHWKYCTLLVMAFLFAGLAAFSQPANNTQANAITLTQKDHWTSTLAAYTNVGATNDGSTGTCGSPNSNVWFKFQAATAYINFKVLTGSSEGTIRGSGITLWNSANTQVTCIANSGSTSTTDMSIESVSLVVGEWYNLSIQTYSSSATYQGTFTIYVNDQPSFDVKIGAIELTQKNNWCSALATYSNVGATADGSSSSCGAPDNNVWFKFQASTSYIKLDVKTGSTEGTVQYPEIALWSGSNVQVICSNYTGSSGDVSIEKVDLTVGEWYYVSIYTGLSSTSNQGTFSLCLNDQPTFNHKIGALELTQKNNWCSPLAAYSNVGATADGSSSTCGSPDNNVWFKFQASTSYIKLDVKTGSTEGTVQSPEITLWNNINTEVVCANSTGSSGDVSIEKVDLIVGEWYFVSVYTGPWG